MGTHAKVSDVGDSANIAKSVLKADIVYCARLAELSTDQVEAVNHLESILGSLGQSMTKASWWASHVGGGQLANTLSYLANETALVNAMEVALIEAVTTETGATGVIHGQVEAWRKRADAAVRAATGLAAAMTVTGEGKDGVRYKATRTEHEMAGGRVNARIVSLWTERLAKGVTLSRTIADVTAMMEAEAKAKAEAEAKAKAEAEAKIEREVQARLDAIMKDREAKAKAKAK